MKKIFKLCYPIIVLLCCIALSSHITLAEQQTDAITQEIIDITGAYDVFLSIPSQANEYMKLLGIDDLSAESITGITPLQFIELVFKMLVDAIKKPQIIVSLSVGIMIFAGVSMGFGNSISENQSKSVYNGVCMLAIAGIVLAPLIELIKSTLSLVENINTFVVSFTPLFATTLALNEQVLTAQTYSGIVLVGVSVFSQIIKVAIVPTLCIFIGFSIVSGSTPELKIDALKDTLKSIVTWVLSFIMTVFTGLLTIQSVVSKSADTVANKTAGFFFSNFIPVVGGNLSSALASVQGCMGVIKSTVGTVGILGVVMMFLPILLKALTLSLAIKLCIVIAGFLNIPQIEKFLSALSTAVGIITATICCFATIVIVATAMVLAITV